MSEKSRREQKIISASMAIILIIIVIIGLVLDKFDRDGFFFIMAVTIYSVVVAGVILYELLDEASAEAQRKMWAPTENNEEQKTVTDKLGGEPNVGMSEMQER